MSNHTSKPCRVCGNSFPATKEYFHADKARNDGLANLCKSCAKAKRRAWYVKNQARAIEYSQQWVADNYQRTLAYNRQWGRANPDKKKQYNSKWKTSNRPKHLASRRRRYQLQAEQRRAEAKAWRAANPEKVRIQWKVRQARERCAEGNHIPDDIRALYQLQNGHCAYCGITLHHKYHVDHIMPLSRGGSNNPDNLALACRSCNLSKKDKTVIEWLKVRGW